MNNVFIEKIYLKNYKLFEDFTLNFSEGLNVFDGPNGYGKTSIFDAIEFLVTGDINRVTNSNVLHGNYSYQKVFFAKDSKKDVVIKAQFRSDEGKFILVKRVEGYAGESGSADINPKKLKEITKTYVLPDFDYVDYDEEYCIDSESLIQIQEKYFGAMSQNLYALLYYVQQEDRLDFFKNTEKSRVSTIDTLFQIKEEKDKLNNINHAKQKLNKLIKRLEAKIADIRKDIAAESENIPGNDVKYKKLLQSSVLWDEENPNIKDKQMLDETLQVLDGLKNVLSNWENYKSDIKNQKYNIFLSSENIDKQLEAYCLIQEINQKYDQYAENKLKMKFLQDELQKVKNANYTGINFEKLGNYLDRGDICTEINNKVDEYKKMKDTSAATQNSINELLQVRMQLMKSNQENIDYGDSKCPYCGHDWVEATALSNSIETTTVEIKALLGTVGKQMNATIEEIRKSVEANLQPVMIQEMNNMNQDKLLVAFTQFEESDLKSKYEYVKKFVDDNKISFTILDQENPIEIMKRQIINAKKVLPEEYYQKKKEYQFDSLMSDYFENIEEFKEIRKEEIIEKEKYLKYNYGLQQKAKLEKVEALTEKKNRLKKEIDKALALYSKEWKASISRYQGETISKIEIPFYIYSARILQSYQAGQGILLRDRGEKGEVDAIRFTSPTDEHDILYMMSSGQLSGILLAFSLALHKIFAKDGLDVLLIDDPVQCMDDLNIVSFVELLRTEFPDIQLLISTHEKSFANYIIYKYSKYELPFIRCNLKEANKN